MAQAPLFQRITEKDGLVFNEVHDLCFDKRGTLWIGTAMGLSRFDGSGFRTYTRAQGLPAPRVYDIECDSAGMLWMGTMHGVVRFDPRTDSMRTWLLDTVQAEISMANQVVALRLLAHGKVLCSTRGAIFLLEPESGAIQRIHGEEEKDVTAYNRSLLTDSAGNGCWIGTMELGLVYLDARHGRLRTPSGDAAAHPLLSGIRASNLLRDRHGRIWTDDLSGGGMHLYRPADGSLQHFSHVPGAPHLRYPYGILFLHHDAGDRLWVGDWMQPPCVVNLKDSTLIRLTADPADPATLSHPTVTSWALDARDQLWLGTLNGLSVHDPERFSYSRVRIPQVVGRPKAWASGMAEDDRGQAWIAVRPNLIRLDARDELVERFHARIGRDTLAIYDVASSGGYLWVSTSKGLLRVDTGTDERSLLVNPAMPADQQIFGTLSAGRKGRIWGLRGLERLQSYDPATGEFRSYAFDGATPDGLPKDQVFAVLPASDGTLWLGTESNGLVRMDPATGRCTNNLGDVAAGRVQGIRILALAEDANGRIWYVADGVGLVRHEPRTGSYKIYDSTHGLPIPGGTGIAVDHQGRIWVGLLNGLVCFDPERERFIPVDVDRGQEVNDVGRAVMVRRNGEIWMSQWQEAIHFNPAALVARKPPLAPAITGIWAHRERVAPSPDGAVTLSHLQDQLRIRYSTFDAPGRIRRYASRALPDSAWNEAEEGEVSISNIASGTHHFQFRTLADDGQWSPVTDLFVHIVPPWWQTLWARILFALLLAAAIVLVFRLRLNWIRRRERKEEAVSRTLNELKLQALRAQMDPHFIFNCLNSIDKYILMEQGEQASRYLNRFAKLVRLILNQSDSVSVPLEKEAEMLRYYLELEALRFKTPFAWEVKVDPELALAEAELPTMLVQPYVENAIWHGLQHKKNAGRITVEFRKLGSDLECTIEDDGIGREASVRINAERRRAHQSKSMRVNADRLRLFEETHGSIVRAEIIDLKDRDGNALGTRVRLVLPIDSLEEEPQPA